MGAKAVIVVGSDGSAGSERALGWALTEARAHGDSVLLVHAWEFPAMGITTYGGDPVPVFARDDVEKIGREVLRGAADAAAKREPDVPVEARLVEGHAAQALIDASHDARLIVVGSRGLGGFRGMLMGSVSSAVAHHAHCPIVIVPPTRG